MFTTAPERWADDDLQKAYEELAASSIPAQIGDIQTDQLPGPNVLLNPGEVLDHNVKGTVFRLTKSHTLEKF